MVFAPMLIAALALSLGKQQFKKHVRCKVMAPAERKQLLTNGVHDIVVGLTQWNWSSVLGKVIVLGAFYLLVFVIGFQATVMAMSFFVQKIISNGVGLGASTGIFVCIGLCMFLLP